MIKRFFILLLAIVASVGMMNAKVTWNSSNISNLKVKSYQSYSKEGVTLSANSDMVDARWQDFGDESMDGISFNAHETGGFTFSNTLSKNFTKIEMMLTGPGGWDMANLGSGWSFSWNPMEDKPATITWTGNASTVDLLKEASDFGGERVKSIVFYFVGDSEDATTAVTGVTLNKSAAELTVGGANLTLIPTVLPSNATNKDVMWNSDNGYVAVVENGGVVIPVGPGTATITVTTVDGNKSATCVVTVSNPAPTYTVALKDGTVNADKVTLSATSAVEGATVTVTPDDEYEITAFSAYYVVVEDQLGSIYEIDATLNAETGAYSFTMPAYAVTIEATIAAKPVPEGDIYAGFTATAGSGGFDNEGHANLVDNKFISSNWTKWCTNDGHKSVPTGESESCWWIDFEASEALNPTGYILTTGNDSGSETGRNPKNWVLKAKLNAGDAWTTIATVTNDVTMKNKSFKDYKFFVDQSGSYKYFRFEVFANQGASVMQLCQLRLIGTDTPAPTPAGTVTVVFEANNNQKEVEVTLPHTFACDFENGNGELDGIIQELYALQYGGYCQAFTVPTATGNAAVTASKDGNNHYIAISEAFEGTATVTGNYIKYLDTEHMGNTSVDYTLTISVQGSDPAPAPATTVTWNSSNVSDLQVNGNSYSKEGITLSPNASNNYAYWLDYGNESQNGIYFYVNATGGHAFSNSLGKNFTKIEMTLNSLDGWYVAYLGSGWNIDGMKVIWTGNASTVDLLTETSSFGGAAGVKSIVFYFEGGSEEPAPANSCGDGLTWELSEGVLTISYDGVGTGEMTDFDYEYDQDPVNVAPWKENKSEITTVVIGDGVKSIGNYAFNDLYENFTAVTIANSVERIGLNAFMNAKWITEMTLPSSLKTIDKECFAANFGITSITIPSGVTSIGNKAFSYCNGLTSLTCEATTPPTLGSSVFYKVRSKTSDMSNIPLYVPSESVDAYTAAAQWNAFDVQAITGGGSTPANSCGDGLIWELNDGALTISYTGTGTGVMDNYASASDAPWYSHKDDITSVTITDGVKSVGSNSFGYYGNLVTVTIGNDVETIGYYAFGDCYKFTTLNLGNSIKHIGDRAFMWAKVLTGFTLPSTLETIGERAFLQNKVITSLTIPSSVTSIGQSAFMYCAALTSVTVEATTPPTLGETVFEGVPTSSIPLHVPSGSVAAYTAADQWKAFDIQDPTPAYEKVMNLINEIPNPAVLTAECKAKIDAARAAFIALSDGDKGQVTNYSTLQQAEAAFDNVMDIWLSGDCDVILWKDTTLTVRKHAGEGNGAMADYNYMSRAPWYNNHWYDPKPNDIVIKSVTIEEGVTHLGDYAFAWMSEMKTVTIPSSVTTIPEDAFYWSKAVDDIYLNTTDPSNLMWVLPTSADNQFKPEKATLCHVPVDLLPHYQEWLNTLNVTYVGDQTPTVPTLEVGKVFNDSDEVYIGPDTTYIQFNCSSAEKYMYAKGTFKIMGDEFVPGEVFGIKFEPKSMSYCFMKFYSNGKTVVAYGTSCCATAKPTQMTVVSGDGTKANPFIIEPDTKGECVQAEMTTLPQAVSEITYDGEPHTLVVAGISTAGTVQYSLDNGASWSADLPQGTDPVTYTIHYRVIGGDPCILGIDYDPNNKVTASIVSPAVKAVTDKIAAIPQPVVYTPACEEAIADARSAYDALDDDLKPFVENYDVLTAAEATYDNMKYVSAVEAKIAAIPQPVELKLATRDAIESARAAYDALTADQKPLVSNYQTLLDAEAALAALNPGGGAAPAGALNGAFSINADGDQIAFAKGNLQYQASTTTWQFATNQYDMIGADNANISDTYTGWIDLFGWGTGNCPTKTSTVDEDYSTFVDWGTNAISNGGNEANLWRTLTRYEWNYLIKTRTNADNLKGQATVVDVHGYVLLPDSWTLPAGLSFTASPNNWTTNVYTAEQWIQMEAAGAVFLPATGYRNPDIVGVGEKGWYWSSDVLSANAAYDFEFNDTISRVFGSRHYFGQPVRLVAEGGGPSPLDSAQVVKDLIKVIPAEITLDAACVNAVQAASDAYNALSEATQGALDAATVKKLTDAEAALTALNQAEADKAIAKINAIPQPVELKLATRDAIESARAAYDALTAAQQALVTNYQTLLDAEAALAEKNKGGSTPVDIVWDGNTGIANVDPNTTSPAYEGMTVTVGNGSSFSTYQSRLYFTFYSQPNGGYIFANENGTNITKVVIESTTALTSTMKEVDRMGSGWVISNENKTATWTGNADSVSIWKGQSFTNYWVVDMITFTVNGTSSTPLDSAQAVKDLIDAIPMPVTLEDACVNAVQAARDAYNALSDAAKGALDDATVQKLNQAIADYTALIQAGADEVIAKINNIPLPVELKLATRDSINNARAAYDALTADQKALVSNYQKLTDAEDAWAQIYAGHEDEMVQAEAVAALIEAIPDPVVLTSECENAINLANDAFSQLSNVQKAMLDETLVQKLTDALATYKSLADQDGADAVIARIDAIPSPVVYSAECKEAISDARAAYDALSDEAKDLVNADELKKLTDAEAAYAALAAEREVNVAFLGKEQTVLYQETIALTKLPNGAPDENGWAFDHWEVMSTPMYAGLHLQAVYRYLITLKPQAYDTLMYSGLAQTLIAAGEAEEGHLEYRIGEGAWDATLPQATDAGTYAIQYKLVRTGHEDFIAPDTVYAQIAKAPVAYTAPVAYDTLAYNYGPQTLVLAGQTNDGTFEYTLTPSNENSWSANLPQGMNAGAYSVYFRVNGDMNHLDSVATDPVVVNIAKRDIIVTAPAAYDTLVYNAQAQTLAADGTADFNTMEYTLTPNDDNSWLTVMPTAKNAGSYDVYYRVPGDANHNDYAPASIEASIAKAPLTITANDSTIIYADAVPEFEASYSGWHGQDGVELVSGLQFATTYEVGSYVGTYDIVPSGATADNYTMTYVNGTLTVTPTVVYVSGAEAQIAKFADGHANAVVLEQGVLNGIKLNDPIAHVTTAAFSSADVAENLTITLFYELTGDAALLNNYHLDPTSDIFTTEGVIIEPFIPDNEEKPEDEEAKVNEGIEIYAYGYCDGSGYSLKYHLESGNPDQYKIDFEDSRFTDVDWTNLVITGKDGTIDIEIPVDMPTGDYTMTVYFRDSRFDWLESRQFNVTFHVNLPETYVRPLFDNVIALVDTCHCLTDIQWYWRANSSELWQPIEGANGYYYHVDGKLTGEYFVSAKMNGEPTYTCGQTDMETLYGAGQQAEAPVVRAYPNPVVNSTTVTIENSIEWIHNIRIVNLMGVEVMNDTFEGDKTSVEMGHYPQGNYMISVDGIVVKVMKK